MWGQELRATIARARALLSAPVCTQMLKTPRPPCARQMLAEDGKLRDVSSEAGPIFSEPLSARGLAVGNLRAVKQYFVDIPLMLFQVPEP